VRDEKDWDYVGPTQEIVLHPHKTVNPSVSNSTPTDLCRVRQDASARQVSRALQGTRAAPGWADGGRA